MLIVKTNADTKRNVWQGKNIAFNSLICETFCNIKNWLLNLIKTMTKEIVLNYYNEKEKIGFNNLREAAYDVLSEKWLPAKEHLGRLVYGNSRIPYKKIVSGISHRNFKVQEYCPF